MQQALSASRLRPEAGLLPASLTAALLAALAACSHDVPRDNPVDPDLTPPVELEAVLDDSSGAAALS